MALAPDDFVPGMFVTVLDTTVERPHPFAHATGKETIEMKEYAGSGVVLEVLATSFPFVLVRNHTTQMLPSPKVFPVDLRRSRLIRLSDDYVQIAINTYSVQNKTAQPEQQPLGSTNITGPFLDEVKDSRPTDERNKSDKDADNPA